MKALVISGIVLALALVLYTQITIFVVPPIGAVPEGRTIVLLRYGVNDEGEVIRLKTDFIDSADAVCRRKMGYVILLCRAVTMGMVAKSSKILLRLPYSETLSQIAETS